MSRRSYEDLRPRRSGRSEKKKDEQEQADSSYSYDQSAEQERPEKQSLRDRWESFKVGVKNQAEKAAQDPYAGYATDPVSAVNMGHERPAAKVSKPGQKQGQQQKQEADGGEGGTLGALWSTLGIGNKPEDKTKENNAWESFADDEEADEGVEFPDEEPANGPTTDDFFPSSDEPLPSESMSDRVKTQEDLVAERNALQKQYSELHTLIYGTGVEGHDFDASAYDRLDGLGQQIKALNDQIEGRAGNILTGSLGQYFSGMTDMERTLYEAGQGARDTMNAEYLADAKHALERAEADYVAAKEMHAAGEISEEELASWKRQRDEAQQRVDAFSGVGEAQRGATAATAELADQMLASAQEDLETAKAGLSGLGKAGVDIATNVLQMGMDAGTGNLTGAGALFSMYLRTFGSSAQEARQSGADIWDQVSYGTVKAGIEVASEKMFDGVAGIYGKGSFDDFAEGLIRHLADSDTGRTILRVIEKGLEEGTEELVSDLFGPIAETIINDETLRSLFFDENGNFLRGSYSLNGQEVLYDFLIGAAIGSLGGTVEIITGQNAQANKELREADAVAALAASANQNQSAIKQAPGMEIGQETDGGDGRPQSAADVVMDALARPTANERLARREAESMANTEQAVADSVRRAADKIGTWLPESDVWKAVDWLLGRATEIDNAKTAEVVDAVREAAGEAQGPEGISTTPTSAEASTAQSREFNNASGNNAPMTEQDLDDYMATGEREHTRNAKKALLDSGESPILTTVNAIKDFIRTALGGGERNVIKAYGKVGTRMSSDIAAASDGKTNVSGYYLELDGNRVGHLADHVGEDSDQRNIPLTEQEAENLTDYIDNYDEVLDVVTRKDGQTRVYLAKDAGNGQVIVVELVSKGRRSLQPVTAWKNTYETFDQTWGNKKGTAGNVPTAPVVDKNAALGHPQSGQGVDSSNDNVPQTGSLVKQQDQNNGNPPTPPGSGGGNITLPGQPSMKRSQTESNTLSGVARALGGEQEELYYIPQSERQTLTEAVNRVRSDMNGEMQHLMDKEMWNAADIDTGLTIYGILKADAVRTGDNTAANAWARIVQSRGTRSGQALQAFSKWTRSGIGQANESIDRLEEHWEEEDRRDPPRNEQERQQREEERNRWRNDILDFGEQLDQIQDGDLTSIRNLIQRQSEYRGTGTLVERNYRRILDEINDYDYLREYATRQLFGMADDVTNTASLGQRLKTWQVNAQLSRLGTFFRNIGGNVLFGAQDTLTQDGFGVALDWLVSHATGHRTVGVDRTWFSAEARRGAREAFLRSVLEVSGDVNMSGNETRYGTTTNRTFKMNGNGFERFMSRWEQLLGYSLSTSDRVSRGQIETAVREGLRNTDLTDEQIQEIAEQTADYRLFQNHGTAYRISKGIHDVLNIIGTGGEVRGVTRTGGFGLGDLVNPYPGVPANLAVKALEYSRANIIKGGVEMLRVIQDARAGEYSAAAQNRAVMDMARGMAGLPIIALLAAMFKSGIVRNNDDEEDLDAAAQNKAEGKTGVQINLSAWDRANRGKSAEWKDGDDLLSVGWLEPMNAFMAIASMIADESEDRTIDTMAKDWFAGSVQSVLEMPVMGNIANVVDTFKYSTAEKTGEKALDAGIGLIGDAASGMIPAPISQAAKTGDLYYRDTSADTKVDQVINNLLNNIPGLRETLPVKTDNFGNPKEYSDSALQRFLNNYVLPGAVTELNQTKVSAAVEDLCVSTGEAGVYPDRNAPTSFKAGGEKVRLDSDERRTYHQTYGDICDREYAELLTSGKYDDMSDADRVAMLGKIKEYAGYMAKRECMEARGETYSNKTWDKVQTVLDTGIGLVDYLMGREAADKDGNGSYKQDELFDWLSGSNYTEEQKAAIWDANQGKSDKTWDQYYGKRPETVIEKAGKSPEEAKRIADAIDSMGKANGSITQDEIKAYYKSHKDDEAMLRALWDSMGWKTSFDKGVKK